MMLIHKLKHTHLTWGCMWVKACSERDSNEVKGLDMMVRLTGGVLGDEDDPPWADELLAIGTKNQSKRNGHRFYFYTMQKGKSYSKR